MSGFPGDAPADLAIVGEPMAAVIAAAPLRRAGLSVRTYLSGSEKKPRRKAVGDARSTLSIAEAQAMAGHL